LEEDAEFDRFFDEHYPIVIKCLVRKGYTIEEAKDAGIEGFVGLYRNWGTVTSRLSYVFATAFRFAARQAMLRRRELATETPELGDHAGQQQDVMEAVEDRFLLTELLSGLPETQGRVIALDLAGFKGPEIARILDTDPGTVRSNRRHAIKTLRLEAERRGLELDDWGCSR
jgi:RNA polymerase sigma factor (sigma-70 family)